MSTEKNAPPANGAAGEQDPPVSAERCVQCSARIEEAEWFADISAEIENRAKHDGQFAMAYAGLRIARALEHLGTGNAATPMGAIEFLAYEVRVGLSDLAVAQRDNADAIREHRAAVRAGRERNERD